MNTYCNVRVERWVSETIPQPDRSERFAAWIRRSSLAEISENARRLRRREAPGEDVDGVQRVSTFLCIPRDVQDRIDAARDMSERFSFAALVCRCFARYSCSVSDDEEVTRDAPQSEPEQTRA